MHNPENERIKRAYFIYLKEARRLGEHSIDGAAAALAKFEDYTKYRDFKRFHIQQAIEFKSRLSEHISPRTGERCRRRYGPQRHSHIVSGPHRGWFCAGFHARVCGDCT